MKNWKHFLAVMALLLSTAPAFSRAVSNPSSATPDAWSVFGGSCGGGSAVTGCEIAVDYTGNLLPTVSNAQTLGTAALPFSDVEAVKLNSSGAPVAVGVAGTTPAIGTGGTAASSMSVVGLLALPAYQEGSGDAVGLGVTASTTIPVNASHIHVIGVGAVTLTSTPNIATTTVVGGVISLADGTFLIIDSTATPTDAVTFQSSGTLTNSGLQLGAGTRAVSIAHNLGLIYDAATHNWKELWYH